ncbi:HPr kinase/phosphorylase [Ruegeria lacuscaerulensis]|uniref:HPr kinase/phosphorylase n=1 Tax=Ruegeria lacuscaerulensis TaxID=55218 RepID=UPI0014808907|nr:HPr kinase/phosphatase C-terminal domain-containing protein [Ruegeria lacuscaerulensis]
MSGSPLSDTENQDKAIIHASCVAVDSLGVVIIGASGSGKSGLALQMMALGAGLVGDDRVVLRMDGQNIVAEAAPNISGLIEARGVGLLCATNVGPVPVACIVDMDQTEQARLPDPLEIRALRQTVPLLRGGGVPNLAAALFQMLKMGRVNPEWPNT